MYFQALVSPNYIHQRCPAMSAHASIFDQVAHDQRPPQIKQKWRDKFFSNEGKSRKLVDLEKSEQDVDEFLRPSSSRSNSKPSLEEGKFKKDAVSLENSEHDVDDFLRPSSSRSSSKPSLDLPVPRIDVSKASRWPSAAAVSQINLSKSTSPRRKTPRREGLRVEFTSAAPYIIGEGGDEAELPAIAVSDSRGSSINHQPVQSHSPRQGARSVETFTGAERPPALPNLSLLKDDSFHRPMTLQRRPTGFDDNSAGDVFGGVTKDESSSKFDDSVSLPKIYSQPSVFLLTPRSSDADYVEPNPERKFGEVAHHDVHPQPISLDKHNHSVESTNLLVPTLDFGLSLSNSLTPIPSPSPSINHQNPTIPKIAGHSLKSDYFQLIHEQTSENPPRASPRQEVEGFKPLSEPRSFTIRSLAKNLGDDALHDFGFSIERFYGIFQLGATATSSLMEISFAQWIRTAAFWFLKGRGKLEVAVRSNGRPPAETNQVGSRDISRDLGQAYLDLAKALWIVEKITPNHPEPKKFGNTGMSSLMAIVASFGEKKLAEQIGMHLSIIANMRALAMSMKRNDRLPTSSFEIRGLDTRIFVKYPALSSGVANLLSNHSRSIIDDGSRSEKSFLPFLVGDTKRHFLYSTSFVDLILAAPNDAREQIIFPCALSVLRERTARDLKVVIASQDGQINIVIQNSGEDGLTWEEVQWKIKTHNLILKLWETVDVQVQFSEKDFKTLWGIHDYTRTIQNGLQCGKGEREVFTVELPNFQNLDHENSKSFPSDPIKNCLLRLYEKKGTFSEAPRGLKYYDGHRLVVVTPANMKTLSSINLECGKQKPVLYNFLRGDGSAPALLLKFSKSSPSLSMVMTFDETKSRGLFHSLLNGTSTSVTESCSQPLPLKTFSVSRNQSDDFGPVRSRNFLNEMRWEQLRVIDIDTKGPTYGTPRTFEHLRIWIEADVGSFVDYMNLGK